jgi:hypothetical protein
MIVSRIITEANIYNTEQLKYFDGATIISLLSALQYVQMIITVVNWRYHHDRYNTRKIIFTAS